MRNIREMLINEKAYTIGQSIDKYAKNNFNVENIVCAILGYAQEHSNDIVKEHNKNRAEEFQINGKDINDFCNWVIDKI